MMSLAQTFGNKPPVSPAGMPRRYRSSRRNLSALEITDTDDRLMAAAAIIGDSSHQVSGYMMPAATGTPAAL